MSHLWGCVLVLEIVFVGQCEVFVCLDFVIFSLGCEAHRTVNGVSIIFIFTPWSPGGSFMVQKMAITSSIPVA